MMLSLSRVGGAVTVTPARSAAVPGPQAGQVFGGFAFPPVSLGPAGDCSARARTKRVESGSSRVRTTVEARSPVPDVFSSSVCKGLAAAQAEEGAREQLNKRVCAMTSSETARQASRTAQQVENWRCVTRGVRVRVHVRARAHQRSSHAN